MTDARGQKLKNLFNAMAEASGPSEIASLQQDVNRELVNLQSEIRSAIEANDFPQSGAEVILRDDEGVEKLVYVGRIGYVLNDRILFYSTEKDGANNKSLVLTQIQSIKPFTPFTC